MCGITGFALPPGALDQAAAGLEAMCRAMTHRGPDDQGLFIEPPGIEGRASEHVVGLGMRRLSIIDTHGGRQPIFNEDGSVVVVYNGELYNHPELRARLVARGHDFKTTTDTEVLVHLYEDLGDDMLDALAGMFAFALYDRRRERLLLARDRLGIKPLHLLEHAGALLFASEVKSLVAHPPIWPAGWRPDIDPVSLEAMLMLMYVPAPRSIYKGIDKLPPGHLMTLDLRSGRSQRQRYWDLSTSPDPGARSYEDARDHLKALLSGCVRDHLVSDVPVGAFVSGGVDSSLVAALAVDHYEGSLQTFSIGFDEPAYDETNDALAVVRALGTPHTLQYASYDSLYGLMPAIFQGMDEPFGDSSMLPTFLVSSLASSRLKVVLSGDGGDEVFAGYTKHLIEYAKGHLGRVPAPALSGLQRLLRGLPKSRGGLATDLVRKAEKAARGLGGDHALSHLEMMKLADTGFVAALMARPVGFEAVAEQITSAFHRPERGTPLQRTQYADALIPLADDMLVKVDRMSMLTSLEVRVPLLDHRVVEFGYHLPDDHKLRGRTGKRILKDLYCERFGLTRYTKRKQGFGVPIEAWFQTRLKPLIRLLFDPARLRQQGLFDPSAIGGDKALDVARAAPFVFWNALMIQVWFDLQINGDDTLLDHI